MYKRQIPNVGTFFNFLKTVPGYFICIFTPFFILILVQARNSIKLFRKYKKEQMEEIQAEKKSLEEERVKSQEMMEQLMQMQQAMEQNGGKLPPEYLAQMQASQSAKPPADVSDTAKSSADAPGAAQQPVSHEATMPQQPTQPQHVAPQQHAAPVSYTHLDVYKRQLQYCSQVPVRSTSTLALTPWYRKERRFWSSTMVHTPVEQQKLLNTITWIISI